MEKKEHIIGFLLGCIFSGFIWFALHVAILNIFLQILFLVSCYCVGHIVGVYIFNIVSLKIPLLMSIFLLGMLISSYFVQPINQQREEFSPDQKEFLSTAPPEIVLATTAIGGLRAIIINVLWMRTNKLREEGKHYEIIQLYDLIGKLEPRIATVWEFTAWEMCYNIAANTSDAEEKWRWLWKGIQQLRDYGIRYNPSSYKLHKQLAFLFMHKIGIEADDLFNKYFQRKLIEVVNETIEPGQDIAELIGVPKNYETLIQNPDIQPLLQKISFDGLQNLVISEKIKSLNEEEQKYYSQMLEQHQKGFDLLKKYWTVKKLWENLRMTPENMLEIEQQYMKIDWRLPASQCLYWAYLGVNILKNKSDTWKEDAVNNSEIMNMNRLLFSALREIFEYGHPIRVTPEEGLVCIPNFKMVKPLHTFFLGLKEIWGKDEIVSHEEFLRNVVKTAYVYGRKDIALEYYRELGKNFKNPNYNKSIQEYVVIEIARKIRGWGRKNELENYIIGILVNGYTDLLVNFANEEGQRRAFEFEQFSQLIYQEYLKRHGDLSKVSDLNKPLSLRHFKETSLHLIKRDLVIQRFGEVKGQEVWSALRVQYPETIVIE